MARPVVFLTHSPDMLARYYGAAALSALQDVAEVVRSERDAAWTPDALAAAARDCDIIVSDRRTEAPAELFERLPRLVAFCRCAVDIRNIDVDAASAHGILVTRASAGFMASVSEWIVGMMIDLCRQLSVSVMQYRAGETPVAAMGGEL